MTVAIYARTSTTEQHNEPQVRELTEHAARRGWEVAGVYEDQISGVKASRPALDRLMADARRPGLRGRSGIGDFGRNSDLAGAAASHAAQSPTLR